MNDCLRAEWGPTENSGRTATKKEEKWPKWKRRKEGEKREYLVRFSEIMQSARCRGSRETFHIQKKGVGWFITTTTEQPASWIIHLSLFTKMNLYMASMHYECIYMKYFNASSSMFGFPLVPVCSSSTEKRQLKCCRTGSSRGTARTVAPSFHSAIQNDLNPNRLMLIRIMFQFDRLSVSIRL